MKSKIMSFLLVGLMVFSAFAIVSFSTEPTYATTTTGYTYFNESGLPSGTSWSVTYNAFNSSSTSNSIKFSETVNVLYSYTVHNSVSGIYIYTPSPSSGSAKAPSSVSITFSEQPFTANISTSHNPTDVGVSTYYYSHANNTRPGNIYEAWEYINGVNKTDVGPYNSNINFEYTYGTAGTYTYYFQWHVYETNITFDTPTLTVTVNPPVTVSISSSKNPIDYGMSVTFNSVVSGGTQPYSYQWSLNGANVSGATSSTWTTSTLPVGNDSIRVWVTDSVGDPAPGHPNSHIPAIILSMNPLEKTVYIGDSFGISVNFVGSQAVWNGNSTAYTYAWYVNGKLIPGAANSSIVASQNVPGTYVYTVKLTGTGHNNEYNGKWIGRYIVHVTGELAPNSVKFVESGLPVGSYWSAVFIVLTSNTSYPYGSMFWDPDGLITKVTSNGLPAVVINPPNGTWTWFVRTYVWNNTTQSFELNSSMNYASSPYVANITHGIVKMPSGAANGSVIIHIGFTLAGDPPSNSSPAMRIAPLNAIRAFSTMKEFTLKNKVLPIGSKDPTVPAIITKTSVSPVSKPTLNFISFIFVSLVGVAAIISALMVQRNNRKKQRDEEAQD